MNPSQNPVAKELFVTLRRIADGLPPSIWNTSCPATYFKIAKNAAHIVPADYQPAQGDLVFCYKNDDGYISIQQVYPAKNADAS